MEKILKNKKLLIIFLLVYVFLMIGTSYANAQAKITNPPTGNLSRYMKWLFVTGLGIVGIAALGAITYGGILYTISAGNTSKKDEAKDIITNALLGMGLLLISYILLNTINPDLVSFKNPRIDLTELQNAGQERQDLIKSYNDASLDPAAQNTNYYLCTAPGAVGTTQNITQDQVSTLESQGWTCNANPLGGLQNIPRQGEVSNSINAQFGF